MYCIVPQLQPAALLLGGAQRRRRVELQPAGDDPNRSGRVRDIPPRCLDRQISLSAASAENRNLQINATAVKYRPCSEAGLAGIAPEWLIFAIDSLVSLISRGARFCKIWN